MLMNHHYWTGQNYYYPAISQPMPEQERVLVKRQKIDDNVPKQHSNVELADIPAPTNISHVIRDSTIEPRTYKSHQTEHVNEMMKRKCDDNTQWIVPSKSVKLKTVNTINDVNVMSMNTYEILHDD